MFQHWLRSLLIHSLLKHCFLNKNLTLKIDSAVSTGSHCKEMKYVIFPWPPVVAAHYRKWLARPLHSNWRSGSRQTILPPNIQLCSSDPTIPFKLYRRLFLIKMAFGMIIRLKVRGLNLLQYIYHCLFFLTASSVWHLIVPPHLTKSLLQILMTLDNV